MPDEFNHHVFLSHNSSDKPRVRRLAERLEEQHGQQVRFTRIEGSSKSK